MWYNPEYKEYIRKTNKMGGTILATRNTVYDTGSTDDAYAIMHLMNMKSHKTDFSVSLKMISRGGSWNDTGGQS